MYHEIPNFHSKLLATDVTRRKHRQDIPRSMKVIATMKSRLSVHEMVSGSITTQVREMVQKNFHDRVTNSLELLQRTTDILFFFVK
jgi:hypothetical protein